MRRFSVDASPLLAEIIAHGQRVFAQAYDGHPLGRIRIYDAPTLPRGIVLESAEIHRALLMHPLDRIALEHSAAGTLHSGAHVADAVAWITADAHARLDLLAARLDQAGAADRDQGRTRTGADRG